VAHDPANADDVARAKLARVRFEARQARLARLSQERAQREARQAAQAQSADDDPVAAALARARARSKPAS
jgi:hypothetical protein